MCLSTKEKEKRFRKSNYVFVNVSGFAKINKTFLDKEENMMRKLNYPFIHRAFHCNEVA